MKYETFSEINLARCDSKDAFDASQDKAEDWLIAIMGELGEIANIIHKLHRGFNEREFEKMKMEGFTDVDLTRHQVQKIWEERMNMKLVEETTDLYSYLDLFISKYCPDFKVQVFNKFNDVTEEMGFSLKYFIPDFSLPLKP